MTDPRLLLLPEEERVIRTSTAQRLTPMFLFFLAIFITINSAALFIIDRVCRTHYGDAVCDSTPLPPATADDVSAKAAIWLTLCITALNVLSILFTSFLSASSDVVGRKPIMQLSLACMAFCALGTTAVIVLDLPLWVLVPVYFVSGCSGTFGTFNAALFALTADSCSSAENPRQLKRAYAALEASIFTAGVAGPLLGGWLQGLCMWYPFAAAAALYLATMAIVALALPETVQGASVRRVGSLGGFFRVSWSSLALLRSGPGNPAFRNDDGGGGGGGGDDEDDDGGRGGGGGGGERRPWRRGLVNDRVSWCLMFFLCYSTIIGAGQLFPFFTKLKFSFSSVQVGALSATSYGAKAIALVTVLPLLISRYGREAPLLAARLSCSTAMVMCVLFGFCPSGGAMFGLAAVEGFDAIIVPMTRAVLCESAGEQDRGKVLGLIANLETLAGLVVPLVVNGVYAATVDTSPSIAFWALGGAVGGSALLLSTRLEMPQQRK